MNSESWQGKKILVVDDSESVRRDLVKIYQDVGLEVVGEASDGVIALEEYNQKNPDLVSMDIIMPNMDGIECYKKLREINREVKLFFVSVLSGSKVITDAFAKQVPPELFLTKPLDEERVTQCLMFLSTYVPSQKSQEEEPGEQEQDQKLNSGIKNK